MRVKLDGHKFCFLYNPLSKAFPRSVLCFALKFADWSRIVILESSCVYIICFLHELSCCMYLFLCRSQCSSTINNENVSPLIGTKNSVSAVSCVNKMRQKRHIPACPWYTGSIRRSAHLQRQSEVVLPSLFNVSEFSKYFTL